MLRLRKRQAPLWVVQHQQRRDEISILLAYLQEAIKGDTISGENVEDCIELNPLDYDTGVTSSSVTPYFGRRLDLRLPRKASLVKTQNQFRKAEKLIQSERDTQLSQALAHEIDIQVGRHYRELEFAKKVPYEWMDLANNVSGSKKIQPRKTKTPCKIRRAVDVVEERRNHRIVTLEMGAYPDPDQPTTTELQVLLNLMHGGDWKRRSYRDLNNGRKVSMRTHTHHVVPVLMVATYYGGQARVIWGYYDQMLKVQYTELQQFTTSNLAESLDSLIQWALPIVRGNTTHTLAMSSIAESSEEEEDLSDEEPLVESQVYEQIAQCSACKLNKKRRKRQRKSHKKRRRLDWNERVQL